ncbi:MULTISPECIES: lytic polysaccharide monooxygenase [unclassified Photobacterium]|uniref:lytic polysaccharide monooxygenase n=1 Tax=unclassified Photobacterium TaxID=2628852 RepID=UPI001EDF51BA|nr:MULTISPECIES: lytic polysaccharide monooxygenase [unclassified Photobacterium]MCG3865609.1 lytic polysaccharide monooxygenase [Photobacterium sp. Ph6]MCG3877110.1 lytic polysaccharide monooxygenase [Photobacterium sp. Ph5]
MSSTFTRLSLSVAFAIANLSTISVANAHGWAEFPPSRTEICDSDGNYWGGQAPNQACRTLFAENGGYPFTQKNENAALTKEFNNIAEVKKVVTDGLLCAGGDTKKDGLDIPSPNWQKTDLVLDENGEFDFVWTATAAHNPSFWEFYLTRPGHDFSQPLRWDDLDLVFTKDNIMPVEESGKLDTYRFKVKIPADRAGDAVLYTRWQRIDPAGEGFYNCSDVVIKGGNTDGGITPPPVTDGDLFPMFGYFVTQGHQTEVGDIVRFRLMAPGTGKELFDLRLDITAANQPTWQLDLAKQINSLDPEKLFVGVWNSEAGKYELNTTNVFANKVWAAEDKHAFAVSVIKPLDPIPPVVDPELPEGSWNKSATYLEGDEVTHAGKTWKAGWWTQGDEPGKADVWKVVLGEGEIPEVGAWSATQVYNENDVATHKGSSWKAGWYTKGDEPGTTGEWGVWRKL